jgi:hypothetical protein
MLALMQSDGFCSVSLLLYNENTSRCCCYVSSCWLEREGNLALIWDVHQGRQALASSHLLELICCQVCVRNLLQSTCCLVFASYLVFRRLLSGMCQSSAISHLRSIAVRSLLTVRETSESLYRSSYMVLFCHLARHGCISGAFLCIIAGGVSPGSRVHLRHALMGLFISPDFSKQGRARRIVCIAS